MSAKQKKKKKSLGVAKVSSVEKHASTELSASNPGDSVQRASLDLPGTIAKNHDLITLSDSERSALQRILAEPQKASSSLKTAVRDYLEFMKR